MSMIKTKMNNYLQNLFNNKLKSISPFAIKKANPDTALSRRN